MIFFFDLQQMKNSHHSTVVAVFCILHDETTKNCITFHEIFLFVINVQCYFYFDIKTPNGNTMDFHFLVPSPALCVCIHVLCIALHRRKK